MSQWHGGKGSKPRKVDKDKFSENWDTIFRKKDVDTDDNLWYHMCKHDGGISTMKGQSCNWCGLQEDGTYDQI